MAASMELPGILVLLGVCCGTSLAAVTRLLGVKRCTVIVSDNISMHVIVAIACGRLRLLTCIALGRRLHAFASSILPLGLWRCAELHAGCPLALSSALSSSASMLSSSLPSRPLQRSRAVTARWTRGGTEFPASRLLQAGPHCSRRRRVAHRCSSSLQPGQGMQFTQRAPAVRCKICGRAREACWEPASDQEPDLGQGGCSSACAARAVHEVHAAAMQQSRPPLVGGQLQLQSAGRAVQTAALSAADAAV